MITPVERVLQAIEENYMTLPNRTQTMATQDVEKALEDLLVGLGWCEACWGRGYLFDGVGGPDDTPDGESGALVPLSTAHVTCCPYCGRGKTLEKITHDDLITRSA